MALQHIDSWLKDFDIEYRVPIYGIIAIYSRVLYNGATREQIERLAYNLSQVSGGSGLDIAALLMTDKPESDEFVKELQKNCTKRLEDYKPGEVYPMHLKIGEIYYG